MTERVLTIAQADDWQGIYISGKLIEEGHSIELKRGIELALEKQVTKVESRWVDLDWVHERGSLPDSIEEIKWDG